MRNSGEWKEKTMAEVNVVQQPDNEVPAEVLAKAIEKIGNTLTQWRDADMKRHALVVLLVASTRVCKRDVEAVLNGIDSLKRDYCLPKPAPPQKR